MSRAPLRRIVVVGGGQVALLAAIAIRRALPRCTMTLITTDVDPAALADRANTTLPSLAALHARIGVTEADMLRHAGASHRLATRYRDWGRNRSDFTVAFGAIAAAEASTGERSGPGDALAAAQRFAMPSDAAASPLSDVDYALRFAPAAHVRLLTSLAAHLGIERVASSAPGIERDQDGNVAALLIDGGRTIEGDLFIDASGPAALLRPSDMPWRCWRSFTPVDRIMVAEPADPALDLADEARRIGAGYLIRSPGRDATHALLALASTTSDDAGVATLAGAGLRAADLIPLVPGRAEDAWHGKVVAIGDAAAAIEPIGDIPLHLAVRQIALLLDLLPGRPIAASERREYNRRAALLADRTLDYVAAQHALIDLPRPATLTKRIDLSMRHGLLERRGEQGIAIDLWRQLLAGLGLAGTEPRVRAMPAADRTCAAAAHRDRVRAAVALAEPYPAWLGRALAATP